MEKILESSGYSDVQRNQTVIDSKLQVILDLTQQRGQEQLDASQMKDQVEITSKAVRDLLNKVQNAQELVHKWQTQKVKEVGGQQRDQIQADYEQYSANHRLMMKGVAPQKKEFFDDPPTIEVVKDGRSKCIENEADLLERINNGGDVQDILKYIEERPMLLSGISTLNSDYTLAMIIAQNGNRELLHSFLNNFLDQKPIKMSKKAVDGKTLSDIMEKMGYQDLVRDMLLCSEEFKKTVKNKQKVILRFQ